MCLKQSETTNKFNRPIEPAMHASCFYRERAKAMIADNLFNSSLDEKEKMSSYYFSLSSGRYEL